MRYKIYSDPNRLTLDNNNGSFGNKILHLLFLANLCESHDRELIGLSGINLSRLFDFNFSTIDVENYPTDLMRSFYEYDSFYRRPIPLLEKFTANRWFAKNKTIVHRHAKENYLKEIQFLKCNFLPNSDSFVSGHFFEYDLMPSHRVFKKYFSIKDGLSAVIHERYGDINTNNAVAVHFRGTDFNNHLRSIFERGIKLDLEYYIRAQIIAEYELGKDIKYHIFSDDPDEILPAFVGKSVCVHSDSAELDWASMYYAKNIIQSNSSFCWTASLYNKNLSIQPAGGYNYNHGPHNIPFGFKHLNAIQIDMNGRVFI